MIFKINVTDSLKSKAEKNALSRMEKGFRGPIKNEDYKYTMLLISCIGELAFQKFLIENKIEYNFAGEELLGRKIKINESVFEIKTSGYNDNFYRLNLIYNYKQYLETDDVDYIVQVFINGYTPKNNFFDKNSCTEAYLIGYIDFDKVKEFPLKHNRYRRNYKVDLESLSNLENLVK